VATGARIVLISRAASALPSTASAGAGHSTAPAGIVSRGQAGAIALTSRVAKAGKVTARARMASAGRTPTGSRVSVGPMIAAPVARAKAVPLVIAIRAGAAREQARA